jgi:hypothetical protein
MLNGVSGKAMRLSPTLPCDQQFFRRNSLLGRCNSETIDAGGSITKLRDYYKSLYRSHRGPLCKKDDVQKKFHQGSLLLRFPD